MAVGAADHAAGAGRLAPADDELLLGATECAAALLLDVAAAEAAAAALLDDELAPPGSGAAVRSKGGTGGIKPRSTRNWTSSSALARFSSESSSAQLSPVVIAIITSTHES